MKFSLSWLKEHLETTASATEIAETLTQLGHEVDAMELEGAAFAQVVVGRIQERTQHPDADKLGVCQVAVSNDASAPLQQIVCGAPNARAGITVAVALPGAVLPGNFVIGKSKLRGVASNGMICSERELGFGDEHNGIWELETDAPTGTPLAEALGLDDVIFDLGLTPNRGDCFSVYGIARDLAASGIGALKPLPQDLNWPAAKSIDVSLETENCGYFSLIELKNLTNAPSPAWLQKRLAQAGIGSKNTLVDITNYIMMTFGQPLHAFDASKVQGNLRVVNAKGGEKFNGLTEVSVEAQAGDMLICDDRGLEAPISLGGVLGGTSTAIGDDTSHLYLEAAWWDREQIARTGQAHHIFTDARQRYERGVDRARVQAINAIAAQLVIDLCGGEVVGATEVGHQTTQAEMPTIAYHPAKMASFGGLEISVDEQKTMLEKLGFQVGVTAEGFTLTPPTYRTYMENDADVVEELLRLKGYDAVPAALPPQMPLGMHHDGGDVAFTQTARRALVNEGFLEAITYSFISEAEAQMFGGQVQLSQVANPIDEATMTTMRPSLLPGLLSALAENQKHSEPLSRLGEVGTVFRDGEEYTMVAGVLAHNDARHWQGAEAPTLYDAKGALENVVRALGFDPAKLMLSTEAIPAFFHPVRAGTASVGKEWAGMFGEIHPTTATFFGLKGRVQAFCLFLNAFKGKGGKTKAYQPSAFPPVSRDVAFVVLEGLNASDVQRTLQKAANAQKGEKLLQRVQVFDVYSGAPLSEGEKSVAFALTLRSHEKTLAEEDIAPLVDTLVEAVQKNHNATLRLA